jgi:Asp-tRNA(Asn)/Glu-tRNA(Gln) amidotransferase A subunit family amidase
VEYVQANRLRTMAVREMHGLFERVDAYLCPSTHHPNLYLGNATGSPALCVPAGFDDGKPLPWSMTVTARLFGEQEAVMVAREVEAVVGARPVPRADSW